jgi:hypothetical protein
MCHQESPEFGGCGTDWRKKYDFGRIQRGERHRRGIFVVCDDKYISAPFRSGIVGRRTEYPPRRGLGFDQFLIQMKPLYHCLRNDVSSFQILAAAATFDYSLKNAFVFI